MDVEVGRPLNEAGKKAWRRLNPTFGDAMREFESCYHGNLREPMVNSPLIRPYFLGGKRGTGGVPLGSHDAKLMGIQVPSSCIQLLCQDGCVLKGTLAKLMHFIGGKGTFKGKQPYSKRDV